LETLTIFKSYFGIGAHGTVATENMINAVYGQYRKPRGIHINAAMASILDPRLNIGIGIPPQDIEYIYDQIQQCMLEIGNRKIDPCTPSSK
jgi:hypothetical protein